MEYTGQLRDPETQLDYMNARYYDPAQGRFQAMHPSNAGADPGNPQTWNGFAYVNNSPLSYTDPSGMDPQGSGGVPFGNLIEALFALIGGLSGGSSTPSRPDWSTTVWGETNQTQTTQVSGAGSAVGTAAEVGIAVLPVLLASVTGTAKGPDNGMKAKVCSAIPSGRTTGISGGIGGVGSVGGGGELVINYNSGQVSAFGYGGFQVGWNGGASGSIYTGFVYGLNSSNANYSGGFTGLTGGAGPGVFTASSSGGLTGGVGGIVPNGAVKVGGLSFGGGMLGSISVGATATNYTRPFQLGKFWAFNPIDGLLYGARQLCK